MAIALVDSVSKQGTGSGGAGTTASIDTTGATFLFAVIAYIGRGAGSTHPSISDSKSNVWLPVLTETDTDGTCLQCYASISPTVGTGHTFTPVGAFNSVAVAAFSGTHLTFPVGYGRVANGGTATSCAPGSITPGRDNSLVLAALAYRDVESVSADGSFTVAEQQIYVAVNAIGVALAYLIQTTAAAANPTFSWTNSEACTSGIVAIAEPEAASSGGSGGGHAGMGGGFTLS
jgi:hypothetical protein